MNGHHYDFETVKYFTELAYQLGNSINTLWGFHSTVVLGSIGYALSTRNQNRGLSWIQIFIVSVGLMAFLAMNLMSLDRQYQLFNAALEVPENYWSDKDIPNSIKHSLVSNPGGGRATVTGSFFNDWRIHVGIIDALAVIFVSLNLSNLGRSRKSKQ